MSAGHELANRPLRWNRLHSGHDVDRGASLIEYALLIALIAVVCIGAVTFFGGSESASFNKSAESIVTASG